LAKKLNELMHAFLSRWLEDLLIFAGVLILILNTYFISVIHWNITIGNYLTAIILIISGLFLARHQGSDDRR